MNTPRQSMSKTFVTVVTRQAVEVVNFSEMEEGKSKALTKPKSARKPRQSSISSKANDAMKMVKPHKFNGKGQKPNTSGELKPTAAVTWPKNVKVTRVDFPPDSRYHVPTNHEGEFMREWRERRSA